MWKCVDCDARCDTGSCSTCGGNARWTGASEVLAKEAAVAAGAAGLVAAAGTRLAIGMRVQIDVPRGKRHGQFGEVIRVGSAQALVSFDSGLPEWHGASSLKPVEAAGTKHDAGKPRWSLLPLGFARGVVEVLEHGARTYGEDNWQTVEDARRRYYDALQRHVEAWWNGERLDTGEGGSGLHHLLHAACCCAFLWWFDEREAGREG